MLLFKRLLLAMLMVSALTACDVTESAQKVKHRIKSMLNQVFGAPVAEVNIPMIDGVTVRQNVAYGQHPSQQLDIYAPKAAKHQPIIMHLHGGGWSSGSKSERASYINKVNHWVAKGFIVVAVETRLMPDANVYDQVCDLAEAIVMVQKQAVEWGGDSAKLILSGHSSAGTMVSVLAANPTIVTSLGGQRWLGSIAIDSSSLDVPRTMRLWSPEMFRYAYGDDAAQWKSASPINLLNQQSLPMLFACSTQRPDSSCEQAALFVEQANQYGIKTKIIAKDLDHGAIDFELGLDQHYTQQIEQFMASLDESIAKRLRLVGSESQLAE